VPRKRRLDNRTFIGNAAVEIGDHRIATPEQLIGIQAENCAVEHVRGFFNRRTELLEFRLELRELETVAMRKKCRQTRSLQRGCN
jgi:hypothetical protein